MMTKMIMRKLTKTVAMITIDMLALIAVAATPLTAVEGQTGAAPTATTATTTISDSTSDTTSSGIELSRQPVLQERTRAVSETQINYAHVSITYTGNGTLSLPNNNNNTATIANFTSNGSALVSFITQSAQGTETIRTGNGETATMTFYEIVKFNPATRDGKGIIIAEVQTSPTGTLASLNGMILAGIDDIQLNGESNVTLWEWESGISNLDIYPVYDDELRLQ
jgi:hypothetical protein